MKIAHILWGFTTGGIETMLVDIIAEQVKFADVSIFIINDKEDENLIDTLDKKCKIFRFHRRAGSRNIIPLIRYNVSLSLYNPDIIHFHYTSLVKFTFSKKAKVITLHNVHSCSDDYHQYDAIYAISDAVRNYTKDQGFNAITIENGIKVKSILKREKTDLPEKLKFVQVGRLYHLHKGQHILIEALNILVNKFNFNNFSLDFIGDGESLDYLKELVNKYRLTDYVCFLGNRNRDYIYRHLRDYDISFQPSISEGFGLTVAEAMAAQIPVIVSDVPGTMEVIDNGRLGYYFESGNSHSLAIKIMEVIPLLGDRTLRDEAWHYVYSHFDISKTAQKYLNEYIKVIDR